MKFANFFTYPKLKTTTTTTKQQQQLLSTEPAINRIIVHDAFRRGRGGAEIEVQNYLKTTTANPKEKEKEHMIYFIIFI